MAEGKLLWEPPRELVEGARLTDYMRWLRETRGREFGDYDELWQWSVDDLEGFWGSLWDYFEIAASKPAGKYRRSAFSRSLPYMAAPSVATVTTASRGP